MERKNAWLSYDAAQKEKLTELCERYKDYITRGKTERECVDQAVELAEKAGFISLEKARKKNKKLKAGDKVYDTIMGKSIILFTIGSTPIAEGMNILGAHIDSPRLDIKQNPLYEDTDFVLLDTHYYGGIKKYQWVALPLAVYGVIVKKDGTVIDVAIGDKPGDPALGITDLLPHLAQDQMKKPSPNVIEGEDLNLLVGSKPLKDEEKDAVKAAVLKFFKDEYGVEEDDFISAELEIVPAGPAREYGLDRSMVMGYGQDDRVCGFTSLKALLDVKSLKKTGVCLLTDKEEIGSVGATGAHSRFFENAVAEILNAMGKENIDLLLRRTLMHSRMLSSDVSAAYDPIYPSVMERKNSAYFGHGVCFNKFTGARGKSGSNDANAEYIADLRKIMDDNKVAYQTAELGRVDQGGGGTIAYISAAYGMEVIDSGVPVLSMHAPWEICSKSDIYEAKKAYEAFLKNA